MLSWLKGVSNHAITPTVFEIKITAYGPAEVGSYKSLCDRAKTPECIRAHKGVKLEAHHIVESEHLEFARTKFTHDDAPCVLIPSDMHRKLISSRVTAEMNPLGGRHGGKTLLNRNDLLKLYKEVYTFHTPFKELFLIAQNIV